MALLPDKTFDIANASLQWRDDDDVTSRDIRAAFRAGHVSVYFTEVYPGVERRLRFLARAHGYTVSMVAGNDAICLRDRGTRLLDSGATLVNRPDPGRPPHGGHSARHAVWHTFRHKQETVTHTGAHWVTGYHKDPSRRVKHQAMSEEIGRLKALKGKDRSLFFWSGDINVPDERGVSSGFEILHGHGLLTVWDELGVWPSTHGGAHGTTIDVIGSSNDDRRVSVASARAWPLVASDHRRVSAVFKVAR
jgi:hypothetical protein